MPVKGLNSVPVQSYEALGQTPEAAPQIPAQHQESLRRSMKIAEMVGSTLDVMTVPSAAEIPAQPGAYLIETEADTSNYQDIRSTNFELKAKCLSGRVDSKHAVLPGTLAVGYRDPALDREIPIAAKGFFNDSRTFAENFERVKTEVEINQRQQAAGEVAFAPVAVVVAPPVYKGKNTKLDEYDIITITRLTEGQTLDNGPWTLGFNEENLEAAEASVKALGRFNTRIGKHGDAKIKNVIQRPNGEASMIDFETSEILDVNNPLDAAVVVNEDLNTFFDSLLKRGFFAKEPYRTHEVAEVLAGIYLDSWAEFPEDVQDQVYRQAEDAVEAITQAALKVASDKKKRTES